MPGKRSQSFGGATSSSGKRGSRPRASSERPNPSPRLQLQPLPSPNSPPQAERQAYAATHAKVEVEHQLEALKAELEAMRGRAVPPERLQEAESSLEVCQKENGKLQEEIRRLQALLTDAEMAYEDKLQASAGIETEVATLRRAVSGLRAEATAKAAPTLAPDTTSRTPTCGIRGGGHRGGMAATAHRRGGRG